MAQATPETSAVRKSVMAQGRRDALAWLRPFGETSYTFQRLSEMFKPALRRRNPRVDGPRRIVTDVLLMPTFEFGYPVAVCVQMKINDLSGHPDRFCLHRLH
jgi:hypothetical protein